MLRSDGGLFAGPAPKGRQKRHDMREAIFRRFADRLLATGNGSVDEQHITAVRDLTYAIVDDVIDVVRPALVEQAHREEGRRIARELHDEIAHGIAAALIGLQLAELDLALRQQHLPTRLASIRSGLDATLEDVRAMAASMRGTVGPRRLDEALRDLVRPHGTAKIQFDVTASGDLEQVESQTKEGAYLIAREAVRNALLHADGVSNVQLYVQMSDGDLLLEVADDGAGFDVETTDQGRMGLTSMQERADLLDGTLTVAAGPGTGTRIRLTVPSAARDDAP